MKTNNLKIGIAIIIAIACSYNLICRDKSSDNWQSSDDYNKVFKMTTDSGWVQKDGYLENALQVGSISYFRYSNDGQYLFTFGSDYTFRKWDVKTGMVVKEKWFNYYKITGFDIYNDENTMVVTYSGAGSPRNSETYVFVNDEVIDTINSSEWYWPGERGYIGRTLTNFFNKNKTILIGLVVSFEGHAGSVSGGSYALWNLDSNKLAYKFPVYSCPNEITISNSDKYALVSSYNYDCTYEQDIHNSELFLINLENNELIPIYHFNDKEHFHSLAFSNNSKYFVTTRGDSYTLIWNILENKVKALINRPDLCFSKFSINDRFIISNVLKTDHSVLKFHLAETGVEADSISYQGNIGNIAVSPDSVTIAVGSLDGYIRIFQPKIFNKQFFASFSADSTVKQSSNPVHFKDYSFYNPISWFWDFGDGNTSTEQNPLHYYTSKGIYTVKLIVSNGKIIDTLIRKDFINIHNPVIADFDVIINNDTIPFTAQFINKSKGDLLSFNWNFSYDKISSDENPAILFDKWGEYDVSLSVSDSYFSDILIVKNKIIAYPPAIPLFKTCFESHYPVENEKIDGLDCIETFEGDFITLANMNDKYKILMRINKNGKIIWKKNIAKGKKLTETLDSCIVVVGDSITTIKGIYVSKYDIDGNFIWDKLYNVDTMTNHTPFDIKSTIDGGFIIAAEAVSPTSVAMTSCFKIDKNGNLTMYNASYSGSYPEIIATNELNYYLITYISSIRNIRLIKIDNNGNIIWQKKNTKEGLYSSKSIKLKNDDLIIAGWSGSNSKYYHPRILKVDSLGNKIWEYVSNDYNSQYYSISSISDTLFAATGNFNNQLGVDIINNQGELVNSVRFPERNGVINSIITTKDNDLFLTGSITPPYKLSQLYTLLLKHPYTITSVEDEQTENTANQEQPFNIFPNPTNSTATLQYKIETLTHLKIELIDFMGMKVSELENAFKEAGEYSSLINFEKLSIAKGIYFVRFIANGNVFVSKIIFY